MIYPGWLTNQHTTPAYQSGLTDQPKYQPIPAIWIWLTDRPTYLIISIRIERPTNMPEYLSELTDWHQPICLGWLTNQHTSLSIRVDWPTNIPDYISGMTDQPTYLTIWVDWPTNIPAFLSGLTDWQTNLIIYPYWYLCTYQGQLTNQHPVTYEYIFGLTASLGVRFVTIMSKSPCKVCHQYEQVSV